jgi:hypothetical protein
MHDDNDIRFWDLDVIWLEPINFSYSLMFRNSIFDRFDHLLLNINYDSMTYFGEGGFGKKIFCFLWGFVEIFPESMKNGLSYDILDFLGIWNADYIPSIFTNQFVEVCFNDMFGFDVSWWVPIYVPNNIFVTDPQVYVQEN